MKRKNKNDLKSLSILHFGILIYSISAVLIKAASGFPLFSLHCFLFYGLSLSALLVYALVWQQALKLFSLGTAYINRAASALWSLLFGFVFFSENITPKHIAGILIIIAGVVLVVGSDE